MGRLSLIFPILLVSWFVLFDQQIILKTVGVDVHYWEEELTTTENITLSENVTKSYKSTLVIEHETSEEPELLSDDVIELNVGGQRISTYRSTLTAVPNSKLALLFTEDQTKPKSEQDKTHFFDYNPVQFSYLLDQLRSIKRMPKIPAHQLNIIAPDADVRFNFSTMLFELGLNPDRFLSPLVGIHRNLPVNSLIGWKECFRGKYNTPFDGKILMNTCKSKRLLIACRPISDKKTLILAGIGNREDLFHSCTTNNYCTTQMKNGIGFYYAQDHAWGFEGRPKDYVVNQDAHNHYYHYGRSPESFLLNPCDSSDQHSEYRLCWSLRSNVGRGGGDRCGSTKNLHNTKGWERLIYQAV